MEISSEQFTKPGRLMIPTKNSLTTASQVIKLIIYSVLCLMMALIAAYLLTNAGLDLFVFYRRVLCLAAFLLLGIFHALFFYRWVSGLTHLSVRISFLYTLWLSVLIGIVTTLLFFYLNFQNHQLAIMCACSFLLPAAVRQSWIVFNAISSETFPIWTFSTIPADEKMTTIFLNSLEIKLLLKINYFDIKENSFLLTVPGNVELGKMFHGWLMDARENNMEIQLVDERRQLYGWKFTLKTTLFDRALNPALSVADNKIKQHSVILIQRISIN